MMTTTSTTTAIQARRPGPRAWLRMMQAEAKMIMRDTAGMILPLGMPLAILVMQGLSYDETEQEVGSGVTVLDVFILPVVIAMVVATIAVINMPSFLASYRKTRILRRLSVTPASPAMVLVAQMAVSFVQVLVGIGAAFVVAVLFFDANLPNSLFTSLLVLLATCAAMYGLGMLVASVAPTPNAAIAIGLLAFFGIAALGGMFGSAQNLPEPLSTIGAWLPFGAAVEAFQASWLGETVAWENWVSLGATTVIGAGVASAFFRWE